MQKLSRFSSVYLPGKSTGYPVRTTAKSEAVHAAVACPRRRMEDTVTTHSPSGYTVPTAMRSSILRRRFSVLLALFGIVSATGCKNERFERDAAEVRKSVEALKDSLREVQGTLTHAGVTSTFTARVDDKAVYLVSEAFDTGSDTNVLKGEMKYYLDGPDLMVYESRQVVRDTAGSIGEPKTVDLELFFNHKGEIVEMHKAVNGSPSTAEKPELDAVKSRFQALYTEVRRQGSL